MSTSGSSLNGRDHNKRLQTFANVLNVFIMTHLQTFFFKFLQRLKYRMVPVNTDAIKNMYYKNQNLVLFPDEVSLW